MSEHGSDGQDQNKAMRAKDWIDICLTVALVFVGATQCSVYKQQAKIMQDQTKAAIDAANATKTAADAANASAQTASGQLSEMRKQTEGQSRQIRPYIDVVGVKDFTEGLEFPSVLLTIKATGLTPALNVAGQFRIDMAMQIKDTKPDIDPGPEDGGLPPERGGPGPPPYYDRGDGKIINDDRSSYVPQVPQESSGAHNIQTFDRLPSGESRTIFLEDRSERWDEKRIRHYNNGPPYYPDLNGFITYFDGYGGKHHTPFCFIWIPNPTTKQDEAKWCKYLPKSD